MSHLLLSYWLKQVPWLAPESVWCHCSLPPVQRWDRNRTPATDTTIYREKTERRHIELLFIAILKSRWKNSARFPYFWQDFIPVPATSGKGCVCVCVCVCLAMAQLVGSWFSDQGLNSGPPQWKHQVLTTGLPGSSWMVNVLWSAPNSAYCEWLFSSLYVKALDITLWDIFNFLLSSFDHSWRENMPFKQFPKSFPAQRPVYILSSFNPVWKHLYNILKKLYGLSLCLILSNSIF